MATARQALLDGLDPNDPNAMSDPTDQTAAGPDAAVPTATQKQTSFVNTSPTASSTPSGVLDPKATTNGDTYDTNGFLMGTTTNPNGTENIPNPESGVTTTTNTPGGAVAASANAPGSDPFIAGTAPLAAPPPPPTAPDKTQIPGPSAPSPFNDALRQMFLSQLQGDLSQPETAQSSDIAPAIGAFTTQSQRDEQASRDQLAEEAYAANGGTGLHSGAFNTALAQNRENAAGRRENFVGSAVMQGAQQKRTALQQMLAQAVQFGDTQSAQAIQEKIALLDASLQEQGLNQGFATANNQLGFNYASLLNANNRAALMSGLGG